MANSNGGIVIYGIVEKENEFGIKVPTKLKPIPNNVMDKDRLTRLIIENISPSNHGVGSGDHFSVSE